MVLGDFLISKNKDRYESYVNEICNKLNIKSLLEIDLYDLCDKFGMKVNLELVSDGLNTAVSSGKGRRGIITLCIAENEQIERINLAHEFSHLYLHNHSQLNIDSVEINKNELEAFKLASNILIPSNELLKLSVDPELNTTYIIAEDVAKHFNVTLEFAYQRLLYFQDNYKFGRHEEDAYLYTMTKSFDMSYSKPRPIKIKYMDLVILKNSNLNKKIHL
ncbi:ImmA/IrrE family metallo-endopeptidase [Solibacillus silvestris]|uniref:ImmA/IrrE family metallo-endopeptidase n=1 Tax=Solibacillus silvestris TaxID=76853 RepID=UPI003F80B4A0